MNLKSLKSEINNQKGQLIKGKVTKSANTFRKNKPNLSEHKFGAKRFSTKIYERFHMLAGRKNKPNQTQFKANSNPITERPKMNLRNAITMNYKDFAQMASKKQTQFKPKQTQILKKFVSPFYTKTPSKNDGNEVDIYMLLCHYIKHLTWFLTSEVLRMRNFRSASRITPKPARIRKENL